MSTPKPKGTSLPSRASKYPRYWGEDALRFVKREFGVEVPDLDTLLDLTTLNNKIALALSKYYSDKRRAENVPEEVRDLGVDGRFYSAYLEATKGRKEVRARYSSAREQAAAEYRETLARLDKTEQAELGAYRLEGDLATFDDAMSVSRDDLPVSQALEIAQKAKSLTPDQLSLLIKEKIQAERKKRLAEKGFRALGSGDQAAPRASS